MVKNAKIIGIAIVVVAIAVFGLFADGLLVHNASAVSLPVGVSAPLKSFYFVNGTKGTLADFRGKAVLLYLVTTWCSTCAQGTSALGSNMSFFKSKNVSIVEVETYRDFNYSGEPIYQFTKQYAGNSSSYMIDKFNIKIPDNASVITMDSKLPLDYIHLGDCMKYMRTFFDLKKLMLLPSAEVP